MRAFAFWLPGLLIAAVAAPFAQVVDPGRQTFVTRCASCHGTDGNGGELGPNIAARVAARTDQELATVIHDGAPASGMPAFPAIAGQEQDGLVRFLRTLKPRDSFAPARGWKRKVSSSGSGESAVVNKVTWTGGSVPTEEDAVFQFNATASSAKTYTFQVRQTYDDDAVVDWNGSEGSDTPAPTVEAKASLGGNGSPTIAIVALIAGTLGILLALLAILGARGERPIT